MRRPIAIWIPAVALLAAPASAQDALQTKYWPRHDISFPIDLAAFDSLSPRPASIRFYAAPPGKKFTLVANKKPAELDKVVDKQDPSATPRRGFAYTAARDGVEEFAVQYEYADGQLAPANPVAQYRIHFDATPPDVKATPSGATGIRWLADDANLVPNSVRVEGRYPGETQWQFLRTGDLKAEDSFRWDVPPGKTLEVRVFARDKAGNENRSVVIKLGARAEANERADRGDRDLRDPRKPGVGSFGDPLTRTDGGRTGSGFGGLDEFPTNKVKIEYRSTNRLNVKSKITHITRSGVEAAQLYVQSDSSEWRAAGKQAGLNFTLDTPDPAVDIPYDAPKDGLYGFIIQPISRAGTKADDPRPGDAPQYLVEVDTTKPEISLKNIRVGGGGLTGPLVEIEWLSSDKNEMPEPILLEYSEDDKKTWKPITAAKLPNTGKYTWEITDKKLWRFHVRASATDKAGNSNLDVTKEPVLVDLDKPAGTVNEVKPNGEPVSPRKQVNHTDDDRFQRSASAPSTLPNVRPVAADADVKPAPANIGGRIAVAPPKKDEPPVVVQPVKPADPPPPVKAVDTPPIKLDPVPTTPAVIPPPPASGTVTVPELPPLPGDKK
jgi:hypothetical protein